MESIGEVIEKRFSNSLIKFLKLVDPECRYKPGLEISKAWSKLSLTEQRKLYMYLLYRRWRGIEIYGDPYYIITKCRPVPFNWNGTPELEKLIKTKNMVIANFNGKFGTYTILEARLWEMTNIQPLN